MSIDWNAHPVHLLHSEEFGHRVAVCGAVEQSFAGERLNFTIDPQYIECAHCASTEVRP